MSISNDEHNFIRYFFPQLNEEGDIIESRIVPGNTEFRELPFKSEGRKKRQTVKEPLTKHNAGGESVKDKSANKKEIKSEGNKKESGSVKNTQDDKTDLPGEFTFSDQKNDTDLFEAKAKEIEKTAYARGFDEGTLKGREEEIKKAEPIINNFCQALAEIEKVKKEIVRRAELGVLELALAIARKIVGQIVETNHDVVASIVREALRKVPDQDEITVRMNPLDIVYMEAIGPSMLEDVINSNNSVRFQPDESIGQGGCVVETAMGAIDARIESQLKAIEEILRGEYCKAAVGA